ncbi:HEPN domain-containing protein [Acidianus sp. HS-5]|uniref:HEPN domain-containing protein n=1 Tax=Acidianus sp. HS-5 TaxID=2886040 RepID=UPI001F2CDBF9|nr:HEPN domain-containing protein [Acidianus sp. HS-5]BDC18587.1 DNA-binding protein [Acidianus sp. HS-5]
MSGNRVQRLKRRALRFLTDAKNDFNGGYYDTAVFHVEQALQLYIKAIIFELFGKEYEGHGIRELLGYLSKLLKENGYEEPSRNVNEITRELREKLISIENAYIDSRYEDVDYYSDESKELIDVAEKLINFLEEVAKNVKLG